MAQKKFSSSPHLWAGDKPNTKLVLVSRESLLNKPNKQNVYDIDSFNKSSFPQWQKNSWHTDWCLGLQKIKTSLLKVRQTHNLAFWYECSSPVHGTAASNNNNNSSRPTASQLKGVSYTILNWFEMITDHRGHKFPPSLTLLFRSKLDSNDLQVIRNRKFSQRIF